MNNTQSESIENQQLIINSFVESHSDEFEPVATYIDDGISGMTYDRAAYREMMEAVNDGRINAIVVKDLSRIGREQIETLNLIRKEFILHNVRFIAITDDYDSYNPQKCDGLSTSVKLLLNDYYCADISKKVRSAQAAKTAKGDFIGSHAPYGYIKSPENKNRLIIDDEAAEVVRRIFHLYMGGMGKLAIARLLNGEGILNPTMYKRNVLGQNYVNPNRLSRTGYWTYSTINKILRNSVYIGNTVQHKSEVKAYNIRKKVQLTKDKWRIVENTHEAVIDKDCFDTVQKMLVTKRQTIVMNTNNSKYTGILFCGECGRAMHKFLSKPRKNGDRYISFKCGTYSSVGKNMCTIHSIKESELDELVLNEIRNNIRIALDAKSCEYIKANSLRKMKSSQENNIESLREKLEKCSARRKTMLKHLSEGIISTEDFKCFDDENKYDVGRISEQIKALNEKSRDEQKRLSEYNLWLDNILKYRDITEINREIITCLIERINIYELCNGEKEIEIVFKFKNPLVQ